MKLIVRALLRHFGDTYNIVLFYRHEGEGFALVPESIPHHDSELLSNAAAFTRKMLLGSWETYAGFYNYINQCYVTSETLNHDKFTRICNKNVVLTSFDGIPSAKFALHLLITLKLAANEIGATYQEFGYEISDAELK